ncbi:MAG: DUF2854 domain-containing protein [Spirulina sp. SIO3F2]|nr:DUF2854 domain-containing protein [Spirulina sp. SIO3F2]
MLNQLSAFLGRFSLSRLGLTVGGALAIFGFVAYFMHRPTLNLIGFFYGIPLLLGGLALKAAELTPTPYQEPTPEAVAALRESQATDTQNQIRQDVTRYRYGQEAHLDDSLERLGLSPTDEERPRLVAIQEKAIAEHYALVLIFHSPLIDFATWQDRQDKIVQFFGPGIRVELTQPQEEQVNVALVSTPA